MKTVERRKPNVVALRTRPKDEQEAIMTWCKTAHQTNIPMDLDAATWSFTKHEDGVLLAGLVYEE